MNNKIHHGPFMKHRGLTFSLLGDVGGVCAPFFFPNGNDSFNLRQLGRVLVGGLSVPTTVVGAADGSERRRGGGGEGKGRGREMGRGNEGTDRSSTLSEWSRVPRR